MRVFSVYFRKFTEWFYKLALRNSRKEKSAIAATIPAMAAVETTRDVDTVAVIFIATVVGILFIVLFFVDSYDLYHLVPFLEFLKRNPTS